MIEFGAQQTVTTAGGAEFTLDKLRNRHLLEIVKTIRASHGDVLAPCERFQERLSSPDLKELIKEAVAFGRRLEGLFFSDPEVQAYVNSAEGSWHVVKLLLKRHHPKATDDEVDDVYSAIVEQEKAAQLLATATGKLPNGEEGRPLVTPEALERALTGTRSIPASGAAIPT